MRAYPQASVKKIDDAVTELKTEWEAFRLEHWDTWAKKIKAASADP